MLNKEFQSLSSVIGKMNEGISYMKKAVPETRKDYGDFMAEILNLENKLKNISDELRGDSTKRNRNEPAIPGISGYFWDLAEKAGSIIRPIRDDEMKRLEKIRGMFLPVKEKVKTLMDSDFKKLIKRAKEFGAPWIPGFGL